MTAVSAALETWFSQFGLPVYGADDVPADAALPYITIECKEPEWDQKASLRVQVWYHTKDNTTLMQTADAISAAVGIGVRITHTGGLIVLWPDNPLQQVIPNGDCRRVLLLLQMNAYHCPGL